MNPINKNRLHRSFMMLAIIGSVLPATAHAATQGTLGTTSTGSITINATIAGLVQISNLTDLTFNTLTGSADAQQNENVCVWSNTTNKSYTITASGSGTSGAFTLASTPNAALPYSVAWANSTGATSGTALTNGTASATYTSAATTPLCAAGASPTAKLFVTIAAADQSTMVANATYTGVLTLVVAPQ